MFGRINDVGFEYRLRFTMPSGESLDGLLRSLHGFEAFDGERRVHVLDSRQGRDRSQMPQLEVIIEVNGLYVCHYGGGSHLLDELHQAIVARCGAISIEDL